MAAPPDNIWDILRSLPQGSTYDPRNRMTTFPDGRVMTEVEVMKLMYPPKVEPLAAQQVVSSLIQQQQALMGSSPQPSFLANALANAGYSPGQLVPLAAINSRTSHRWVQAPLPAPVAPHASWHKKSEKIVAGEIIGYRAWMLCGERLKSLAVEFTWEPKQVVEGKPLEGFGIHAYKNPYLLMADQRGAYVCGTIAMWGDVIEHEDGYRSQYARIVSLDYFDKEMSRDYKERVMAAYL